MAFDALPQIIADVAEVKSLGGLDDIGCDISLLHEHDRKALAHDVTDHHRHFADDAAPGGGDDVLHLHRFDDGDLLPGPHLVADGYVDGDDHALDGGCDPGRTIGANDVRDFVIGQARRLLLGFHGRV